MKILILGTDGDYNEREAVRTLQVEFERRGYQVEYIKEEGFLRNFMRLRQTLRDSRLILLGSQYIGKPIGWKKKLLLNTIKSSGVPVLEIPGENLPIPYFGVPVDMAAFNYMGMDFRRSGGRLTFAVGDKEYLPVARRIEARYPDLIRILNVTEHSPQRLYERLKEIHVLLHGPGKSFPSAIMLYSMAMGKIGIGPGDANYRAWVGEDITMFYPDEENPDPESGVAGVPFFLPSLSSESGRLNREADISDAEAKLERILLMFTDVGTLRSAGEISRNHVRNNHCSGLLVDRILGMNTPKF